jgi:hypothetical protein
MRESTVATQLGADSPVHPVSVHPFSQPRTILRKTIVAIRPTSEEIARRQPPEKPGHHRPACVTRMVPIEPAARRAIHVRLPSFEFPG